jgi:hypothetical protein
MMMTSISLLLSLAAVQNAATNAARDGLRTCIKEASTQAKTDKVAVDAFLAFAKGRCTAQEQSFTAAIWAIDSKNKVSKKQSAEDAAFQIEDLLTVASERYALENKPK